MGKNLPPGCKTSDIPGNRPIDRKWDDFLDSGVPDEMYKEFFGEEPEGLEEILDAMEESEVFKYKINEAFEEGVNRG